MNQIKIINKMNQGHELTQYSEQPKAIKRMRPLLGTFVEIGVYLPDPNQPHSTFQFIHKAINQAFEVISSVHQLLSYRIENNDLDRLNKSQGEWVRLDPKSALALRLGQYMMKQTHGLFDCTLGKQLENLNVLPKKSAPCDLQWKNRSVSTRPTKGSFEVRGHQARRIQPIRICLDGLAKGLAVDLAVKELKNNSMVSGWVNAGGDLKVFGPCFHPFLRPGQGVAPTIKGQLKNRALATSWSLLQPSKRYPGYIIDSQNTPTLQKLQKFSNPCTRGIWSVLSPQAWLADALTKVACLAPQPLKQSLIKQWGAQLLDFEFSQADRDKPEVIIGSHL